MKIVLSCGAKTKALIESINRKFESNGDELIAINEIHLIDSMCQVGTYFDKALITEHSITNNYTIKDEQIIRERLRTFALKAKQRGSREAFLFLTSSETIASWIYEETISISRQSVIVIKEASKGYSVTFISSLIVADLSEIPKDIIYVPKVITDNTDYTEKIEDESLDYNDNTVGYSHKNSIEFDNSTLIKGRVNDNLELENSDLDMSNFQFAESNISDEDFDKFMEQGMEDFNSNELNNFESEFNNSEFNNYIEESTNNTEDYNIEDDFKTDFYSNMNPEFDKQMEEFNQNMDNNTEFENSFNNLEGFTSGVESNDSLEEPNIGFEDHNGFSESYNSEIESTFEVEDNNDYNSDYTDEFDSAFGEEDNLNNSTISLVKTDEYTDFGIEESSNNITENNLGGFNFIKDSYESEIIDNLEPDSNTEVSDELPNLIEEEYNSSTELNKDNYEYSEYTQEKYNVQTNEYEQYNQESDYSEYSQDENFLQDENYMQDENYEQYIQSDCSQNNEFMSDNEQYNQESVNANSFIKNEQYNQTEYNQEQYSQEQYSQNFIKEEENNNQFDYNYNYDDYNNQDNTIQNNTDNINQNNYNMYNDYDYNDNSDNNYNNAVINNTNNNNQNMYKSKYKNKTLLDKKSILKDLKIFESRGNNIVFTGCENSGVSTIAFNTANVLANLGYTVLLVDFDTENKSQSYLSLDSYNNMEADGANLMAAVNSKNIAKNYTHVRPGFHLLTMGIAQDSNTPSELFNPEKISKFANLAKPTHTYVIYDIPFSYAVTSLSEVVLTCDNLVLVTEATTHGIVKTMLKMCNIVEEDMRVCFFTKSQVVFNKYRGINKLLGSKLKSFDDILKVMDRKVEELTGEDAGLYFEDLHIAGALDDDPDYENTWFEKVQYSDTAKGDAVYSNLIHNILTKKF